MSTVDEKALSVLKSAERWRELAFHAVDDIGGWRDATLAEVVRTPTASYPDVAAGLFGPTAHLVGWATANHPTLDVSALGELHQIIVRWAGDHDSSALPTQAALVALSERAFMAVFGIEEAILSRTSFDPNDLERLRAAIAKHGPTAKRDVILEGQGKRKRMGKALDYLEQIGEYKGRQRRKRKTRFRLSS